MATVQSHRDRASRGEAMQATFTTLEKRIDTAANSDPDQSCDHEWCHGLTTEPLPCFACFEHRPAAEGGDA
jgi:hypothetical protein